MSIGCSRIYFYTNCLHKFAMRVAHRSSLPSWQWRCLQIMCWILLVRVLSLSIQCLFVILAQFPRRFLRSVTSLQLVHLTRVQVCVFTTDGSRTEHTGVRPLAHGSQPSQETPQGPAGNTNPSPPRPKSTTSFGLLCLWKAVSCGLGRDYLPAVEGLARSAG